jgi:basic membrane protein A
LRRITAPSVLMVAVAVIALACGGNGATTRPSTAASSGPSSAATPSAPASSVAATPTAVASAPASEPASVAPTGTPEASASPEASESPTASESPAAVTCDTPLKVGLVTDVGRVNDKGFNQSAFEGMESAAAESPTCFETDYIETQSQSDYAANIAQFTDADYDVVIGVGFLLGDALGDAAKENSDITFISVDGVPGAGHDESWSTNGESLFFAEDQAGYMAGVLAASLSVNKHVGVVGGLVVVPPVERFVEGYINGARSVQDDIPAEFVYTTSFTEPPQGANAANQMLENGADVIFAAGGLTGNGALGAACEKRTGGDEVWAIGVDTDQFETLPEVQSCLVSSAVKNVSGAVHDSLLRIASGAFTPGFHTDDASTGGVGLAAFHNFEDSVPQEVKDLLATTLAGLADGSIEPGAVVDGQTTVPDSGPAQ